MKPRARCFLISIFIFFWFSNKFEDSNNDKCLLLDLSLLDNAHGSTNDYFFRVVHANQKPSILYHLLILL